MSRIDRVERVLFVCTGNVCRSPMARELFDALAEDRGLGVRSESAGVAALSGEPMAPNAVAVLEESGIRDRGHRARQVEESVVREADLVLTMGPRQVTRLQKLFGDLPENIYPLPAYATGEPAAGGLPDPYGQPINAYRVCLRQLLEYTEAVLDHIELGAPVR